MRSIRLSLTVYFLVLLALALGSGSLIVYRTTEASLHARQHSAEQTLREKKLATTELLSIKHQKALEVFDSVYVERCKAEERSVEDALLSQARTLARLVQFRFDTTRTKQWDYKVLGALTASSTPFGILTTPVWVAQSVRNSPVSGEMYWKVLAANKPEIRFNRTDLIEHVDDHVAEYFQINSAWGTRLLSAKMGGRSFDFDHATVFSPTGDVVDWTTDTTAFDGIKLKRGKLLAPAARFVPFNTQPTRSRGPSRPGDRNGPPGRDAGRDMWDRSRMDNWFRPGIYIQVACSLQRYEMAIAAFTEQKLLDVAKQNAKFAEDQGNLDSKLDEDLHVVVEETNTALASLRSHLLLICLLTFSLSIVGTLVLVRLGLMPLQRLSDAVSRVSEKDFRLPIEGQKLPRELSPIAERLSETLEQLKRAFGREKQATADISHELRTPLAALMTTIDVTLRKSRSAEEYREALEDCRASGREINHAVERLLALARLDAGVDRVRSQTIDAIDIANQCVAVVRPLAEARGLSVKVDGDPGTVLQTDPDKLREILNNLLHNAIQYNRPQGTIEVAVHRQNGHLHLAVKDTGIGIAPSAQPHIFERFFRADPSRQSDGLHTGLGLAIVKGYLDLMGGKIEVKSIEGEGSTFDVSLPA